MVTPLALLKIVSLPSGSGKPNGTLLTTPNTFFEAYEFLPLDRPFLNPKTPKPDDFRLGCGERFRLFFRTLVIPGLSLAAVKAKRG